MAYEIGVDVSKVVALRDALKEVQDAANGAATAVDGLNTSSGRTQSRLGRNVAAPSGSPDAGSAPSASAPRVSDFSQGPRDARFPLRGGGARQTLRREQRALEVAEQIGDDDLTRDQQARVARAQRRVDADDRLLNSRKPFAGERDFIGPLPALKPMERDKDQALMDMILTSRFDPTNGRLYPLVGKLRALQGIEGAQGAADQLKQLGIDGANGASSLAPAIQQAAKGLLPLIGAAGAAAAGGAVLYGVAEAGAASMRRRNEAFYQLGGSGANVGAAMALGGDDASGKALQLTDRLREGSVGAAFLRANGVRYNGRYTDVSGNYVRALDSLRTISDVQERIRVARETGLTGDLWTSDLSDGTYRRLKGSRGVAGSDSERWTEAEYRANKEIVGGYYDRAVRKLGGDVLSPIADAGGGLSDRGALVRTLGRALRLLPGAVGQIANAGLNAWGESLDADRTKKKSGHIYDGKGWDTNSDAPIGNGPQSVNGSIAGSIPAGWRGMMMDKKHFDEAVALGWYGG